MIKHLRYCLITASMDCDENRHAQTVMRELGITYERATPQSICDQWWFWNCENIPEVLPPFLKDLGLEPSKCIGRGLSEEDARQLEKAASDE